MIKAPKALPNNRLVNSPAYPIILSQYNELLTTKGRVNNKRFYEEVVSKKIRSYSLQAWYQFLHRFKTQNGLVATSVATRAETRENVSSIEGETRVAIRTNQEATANLISRILNISSDAAQKLLDNPELIPLEKRIELGLKGMKSQDSRIHAIGKMREDNREQERFSRAFDNAAYGG